MEKCLYSKKWFGDIFQNQLWFTLKECCEIKNLAYKTACNRKVLQPNKGIHDCRIGGKRVWHRNTVEEWLVMSDKDIIGIDK